MIFDCFFLYRFLLFSLFKPLLWTIRPCWVTFCGQYENEMKKNELLFFVLQFFINVYFGRYRIKMVDQYLFRNKDDF